ncbi:MAG: hemerythrin domain-containing protein [Myxococcaceae bacterium]|nr:hemerythrin domain-containing protein [Myxococcaceae bacterium]
MHATEVLARQHEEVSQLLAQVRDARVEERGKLLGRLAEALTIHTTVEERHFYPLIRQNGFPEAVDASVREHEELQALLEHALGRKSQDPEVELLLGRLERSVRDHFDKEESELFEWARARIDPASLEVAGDAMARDTEEIWQVGLLEYEERRAFALPRESPAAE